MSVRLHCPEVFDGSSVMDLIILMIRLKALVISNKYLIGRLGWSGMRTRDILQRGQLRLSEKIPLDNSMTSDKTQATYLVNHKSTKQEETQTLHMFGKVTKRWRTQLYIVRKSFLRLYYIP
jgi:hypothetical protein